MMIRAIYFSLPAIWRTTTDSSTQLPSFCCPLFIFRRKEEGVVNTIQSEFNRIGVKKSSQEEKKQDQKPRSKKKLSTREIEELMGARREIYVRRNGVIRRK